MSTDGAVERLLGEIAPIGRAGRTGGFRRFAFEDPDRELAQWFSASCRARGLDVVTDRNGNQWGWWGDPDTGPGVVTGSHLDSVPDGGAYDGPLGVVAALLAVERLRAVGWVPRRPIGVVRFVDEEGARFGLACSGSRLLTGQSPPATVLALSDRDGVSYAAAAAAAGLDPAAMGRDDETLRRVGAFVELHIEQGRFLGLPGTDAAVGVASLIRPHGRWRFELTGRPDHAGTTLLADRDDPMLVFARLVLAVRSAAEGAGALATVGKVAVRPGAVNAIASGVTAWLDARADTAAAVRDVLSRLGREGFEAQEESWTPATELDVGLTARVGAAAAARLGAGVPATATGAGHDAGILARAGVPSAMLFVRNRTGTSHAPAEHADPQDCDLGVQALTAVLQELST